MMKIARRIKHALKGQRLSLDESIDYARFAELVDLAGENLHYRVRAGPGFGWLTEDSNNNPTRFILDWFREGNNEFYETKFFGRYQKYTGRDRKIHYVDCYEWIRRGNVGPEGCKGHEGTIYFDQPVSKTA